MTHGLLRYATAALLLAAAPHTVIACASASPSLSPDPRTWSPIACESCDKAGIVVETRRSVDERGNTGRTVLARVSNLNPHAVTFTLDLTLDGPPIGDPDFLLRQWRLTLPAAGAPTTATTLLALDSNEIAAVTVSRVERF